MKHTTVAQIKLGRFYEAFTYINKVISQPTNQKGICQIKV